MHEYFVLSFCVVPLPIHRSIVFNPCYTFKHVIPVFSRPVGLCRSIGVIAKKTGNQILKARGGKSTPSGFRSFALLVPRRPKTGMTALGDVLVCVAFPGLWSVFPKTPGRSIVFNIEQVPEYLSFRFFRAPWPVSKNKPLPRKRPETRL